MLVRSLDVAKVIVKFATSPATAVMTEGDAAMEKSDEAALMVRVNGRLEVKVPLEPVTVNG